MKAILAMQLVLTKGYKLSFNKRHAIIIEL